jgi:hypothetical protein
MLMPAFHRFPKEADLIGRVLVGFGELEFILAQCVGQVLQNENVALRVIFRLGGTSARIDTADALARDSYAAVNLANEFALTLAAVAYCYSIRNQYAHCHWADHEMGGLFFTNLETAADRKQGFEYQWKHIDTPLLELQEAYFIYAMGCLMFLQAEYPNRVGKKKVPHPFAWQPKLSPPPRHNPPKEHVPPWLGSHAQRRHIELAEEQEQSSRPRPRDKRQPPLSAKQRRNKALKDGKS